MQNFASGNLYLYTQETALGQGSLVSSLAFYLAENFIELFVHRIFLRLVRSAGT